MDENDTYGLITHVQRDQCCLAKSPRHRAGTFDIGLPLSGTPGIECRSGGATNDYQIVVTFGTPVTFSTAQLTQGTGSVSSTSTNNNQVVINLTGVTNAQTIQVTLVGVNDGVATNDITIPMSILTADTNSDGFVNSADISQTKSQSGQAVTISNFREDVNTDGFINSADISLVKSESGTALP